MQLFLREKMVRLDVTDSYFFRMAYQWRFGTVVDISSDVLQYRVCGIIPEYVRLFVKEIQRCESAKLPAPDADAKSPYATP